VHRIPDVFPDRGTGKRPAFGVADQEAGVRVVGVTGVQGSTGGFAVVLRRAGERRDVRVAVAVLAEHPVERGPAE
jgi:hypothetical protein